MSQTSSLNNFNKLDFGRLDSNVAGELNTYRNWGAFDLVLDDMPRAEGKVPVKGKGTKSIFNNVHGVWLDNDMREGNNVPLLDTPKTRQQMRERTACTIKDLVEASERGDMGRAIYQYSDFAYCKYLGKMSNNYLITLRRFPMPCGDHIDMTVPSRPTEKATQQHMPDMGRMVTWIGTPGNDMSGLLKYTVKMNFEEKKAEWEQSQSTGDNSSTPLAQMMNSINPAYQKQVQQGLANVPSSLGKPFGNYSDWATAGAPYSGLLGWRDRNKVYGPLDVMMRTHQRQQGIQIDQEFSITFDYELRSYDGINGKAAMLDLLSNVLAVTYTTGKWWGGGRYSGAAAQSNLYSNLPIFQKADSGELNSPTAVWESISDSISAVGEDIKRQGGGSMTGGIKEILKGIGSMLLGGFLNKLGRPQKFTANALLTDAPVGLWHLTLGNPRAPIMELGNLIMENAEIEHYGPLGIDDFPTGLKVTVKLKRALDTDSAGIEKMYTKGDYRYYVGMSYAIEKMYEEAREMKKIPSTTTQPSIATDNQENKSNTLKTAASTQDATTTLIQSNQSKTIQNFSKTNINDVLRKYFGAENKQNIQWASAEAFGGSVEDKKKK